MEVVRFLGRKKFIKFDTQDIVDKISQKDKVQYGETEKFLSKLVV